ncbi:MAG TPA: DUF6044 family protein [Balneolales bacterium]|nr:DUF6044 family protein [Balneolales bacterium]
MIERIKKYDVIIGLLIVFIFYTLPRIILGSQSYVVIHDVLDSEIAWIKILVQSQYLFSTTGTLPQIMDGLPRVFLISGYNIMVWLYLIFKPFTAYAVNEFIVHIIAYLGMYMLLSKAIENGDHKKIIVWETSLCFALLPFYSIYGLSIAGQPFVLYAFLNLRSKKHFFLSYFILAIFAFYSYLVLSGAFIIAILVIWFFWDFYRTKEINLPFLYGILLLIICYVFIDWGLIKLMLINHQYISHRTAFKIPTDSFVYSLKTAIINFVFGQYHAVSLHTPILFISFTVLIWYLIKHKKQDQNTRLILLFLAIIIAISTLFGFYDWKIFKPLKATIPIFKTFNFTRFNWLHPILWYLVFAFSLAAVSKYKWSKKVIYGSLIVQFLFIIGFNEPLEPPDTSVYNIIYPNVKVLISKIDQKPTNVISYREFYSPKLFRKIADYIGKPQKDYRIGCIGFHPSIAQFNGFYTLGSYQNNYLLSYKKQFRKIIAPELAKSPKLKQYYDDWGSRCYLLVIDLANDGFIITKNRNVVIKHLDLNTKVMKNMGGQYILSSVKIDQPENDHLHFQKQFTEMNSPWRIFLYRVE